MLNEIVLAAKGTENDITAAPFVAGLASQLALPLSVLSVAREGAAASERLAQIETMLDELAVTGAKVEIIESHDAAAALIDNLGKREHPLLCMATQARGPAGEAVFGSVAARVVREGVAPVVLFGPGMPAQRTPKIENLVVCLDASPLSESILPIAAELAKMSGARIWIVKVEMPRPGARPGGEWGDESSYVRRQAQKLHMEYGISAEWEALHSENRSRAIADFARDLPGAMIALTTHGQSGLTGLVVGTVAQRVIRKADCPVLVVRPED